MTKQEVNRLLEVMAVNYRSAFKAMSQREKIILLNTWTICLQDISADVASIAVMQLIAKSKWLPTIAEIREKCQSLHYEADNQLQICRMFGMQGKNRDMYEAIAQATNELRGDEAELSLHTIVNGFALDAGGGTIRQMIGEGTGGLEWCCDSSQINKTTV